MTVQIMPADVVVGPYLYNDLDSINEENVSHDDWRIPILLRGKDLTNGQNRFIPAPF